MTDDAAGAADRAAEYARQVDSALSDLPASLRAQLLADLAPHLAEIADDGRPVVDHLGPPADYAQELRLAADLGPARSPSVPRRMRRPVLAATAGALIVVATAGVGLWVHVRSAWTISGEPQSAVAAAAASPTVMVPDVVGQTMQVAIEQLDALGFVASLPQAGTPGSVIVRSSPAAGVSAPLGSVVELVVSTRVTEVPVPDVVGQDMSAATGTLASAGYRVGVVWTPSSRAANTVVRTTPGAGVKAAPGTVVTMTVSTGP